MDVEGASIIFWDQKEKMFYFPIVEEESKEVESRLKHLRFPRAGIAGWVFSEGKPTIVNNVSRFGAGIAVKNYI